jgi:hypothetical protein
MRKEVSESQKNQKFIAFIFKLPLSAISTIRQLHQPKGEDSGKGKDNTSFVTLKKNRRTWRRSFIEVLKPLIGLTLSPSPGTGVCLVHVSTD